jgi:glucose-1-phosphate thymidylyltransferase
MIPKSASGHCGPPVFVRYRACIMPIERMKGLILAAGHGTRLRPITSLRPKPTISVANKQLVHYAVDNLVEAGVREIGIVVSHDTIGYLRKSLAGYKGNGEGTTFEYIIQNPPEGLAHAVKVSREFLADDPFVMYLGDNLFEHGIREFIEAFRPEEGVNAVLALVPVEDPRQLGVAIVNDGRVVELVEKPEVPPSNLAIAGVYVFDANIHRMIEGLEPGAKGEYQITDAIQRLIRNDFHVAPVEVTGWWKDTGRPEDILDANRLQLLRVKRQLHGSTEGSELSGEVVVEEGAVVKDSRIEGPCLIGSGARVERAYIGPFTTIGDETTVRDAELEYAVVGARSAIEGVGHRIRDSLIGEEVRIVGENGKGTAHRLIVGDKSSLSLSEN